MSLDNICMVMVGTTHPGNIGSAARAMKTMGLTRLRLVDPQQFPSPQAQANAANAGDVLADAQVYPDLDAALADIGLVVGLSARPRRLSSPVLGMRECGEKAVAEAGQHRVALLFGREHSGLTNDELDRCHYLVHIPANPDYSSLNVAAAVQVVAYELRMAALGESGNLRQGVGAPAPAEHLEGLYQHLERVSRDIGFADVRNEEFLMRRLRRLFNRARPDTKEINILRGFLSYIERGWK
ncbi:tRNA (cytosine(32)/uridine(32)-2'-O)-methyltransferase TrmJ [Alkalilimnicola ehrlichii]|uniref:tRNA (cytidine/uridine-2'-O-)-methyltransferase TrmJ n=1 Tax=Alkalilimnicola ehrlichii TaxID=351052 RepID=A0A3E0X0E0_9GAMM|nr:RNA methyltransferase [Alkalilimnicola ehrlichii]RFA30541.1 tRNA (cytosine(32)/uridine(32)-2'-O)-methyltransferase TrmJ [Alkalilimnicola ehrlichii]RFA38089.1 tRNA (cytosine(32)/uridine(32)-2'-O)-methyltransferase TrmJ [Alkalilimnicola ehrlichii]